MKKAILIFTVLAFLMAAFTSCGIGTQKRGNTEITLYFRNKLTNSLSTEKRQVKVKEENVYEIAKMAATELIKGPVKEGNGAVIDSEAKLLKLKIEDSVATVNISSHYSEKKSSDELILRFAIVSTLCAVDGISGVVIQVEGKPIVDETTGKEIGVISMKDIVLDAEDTKITEKTTLSLYFPAADGSGLVKEKREVEIQNSLSLEKTIVTELIKGPAEKSLMASIPKETSLLSIETKDGVCTVNFSGQFILNSDKGTLATTLTLYSVVNSLCELEDVKSVQILINGESGKEFGNFVFDVPCEPNGDWNK